MFFLKKIKRNKLFNIFTQKYSRTINILFDNDFVLPYATVEIIPLMNCIVDLCTLIANKNREFVNKQFIEWALLMLDEDDKETLLSIFDERSSLYAGILNKEIEPRCDWCIPASIKTKNPVVNCCAAFCDIITNPYCATDYADERKISMTLNDSAKFSRTFNNLCTIIAELYNETYKLL